MRPPNTVGYVAGDFSGKQMICFSPAFKNVGSELNVFLMSDIDPQVFDDGSDMLQFLEPTAARTEKTYFAYEGDWYENLDDWNDGNSDQFDLGTGFLGNFASKTTKLTASGSVLSGPTALDYTGKQCVMVGNPIPRNVTFAEIEPVVFDDGSDILQKLESTAARTVKTYFAYEGDWYENLDDWNDASGDTIAVGEAMLGNFASKTVKLNFPSGL